MKITRFWKPLLAIIFWGMSFIFTKIALFELEPFAVITLRLILGFTVILIIAVSTKRNFSINFKTHSKIFLLALVAVFHLWIQVTGLKFTSASNTGWIIGVTPVFMALLGFLFFKEKITHVKISGIIIAFFGLLLLISKGNFSNVNLISNKGDFLVLGSAFTWSVYSIINKKISISYPPLMVVLFSFAMMIVILIPFNLNSSTINSIKHFSAEGWGSILFLGIFCSGIAYVLWAYSLKEMESAKVGAFLYFEPFVTVFTAFLILDEKITVLTLISGLIITFGVVLVNLRKLNFRKD